MLAASTLESVTCRWCGSAEAIEIIEDSAETKVS